MTHRTRRHPRRLIVIAAIFLLIGAAVNVGVAWECATRADVRSGGVSVIELERRWPRSVPQRWPEPIFAERTAGRGWHIDLVTTMHPWGSFVRHRCSIRVFRSGWPMASLQWERWDEVVPKMIEHRGERVLGGEVVHDGHAASFWRQGLNSRFASRDFQRRLPIMPVWPGSALNTLLFGTLAAALWHMPGALRCLLRLRRWRHGHCFVCGYPRAGLAQDAVCPECGGDGGVAKP